MAALHINLLGGFEVRTASGEPLALKGRKTQALLAYLALGPGQQRSREELAALLWGDRGEPQVRSSLRQSLSELRKALAAAGPSPLITDRGADSALASVWLANSLAKADLLEEAKAAAETALTIDPTFTLSRGAPGICYFQDPALNRSTLENSAQGRSAQLTAKDYRERAVRKSDRPATTNHP